MPKDKDTSTHTSEAIDLVWTQREELTDVYHEKELEQNVDAAICYLMTRHGRNIQTAEKFWPFAQDFTPTEGALETLVMAAALLIAEIELKLHDINQKVAIAEKNGGRAL